MKDKSTLDFYAREAETYANRARTVEIEQIGPFLSLVPPGGRILELGCGGGHDSEVMLNAGFDVTPTDGSPELARQAEKRLGQPVGVLLFEDIDFDAAFDGVWANACLLHAPTDTLPTIFRKIHLALRPGGALYASFKTGQAAGADSFGRFFNQPDEAMVRKAMGDGWRSIEMSRRAGSGYFNLPTDWLHVLAVKA